MIKMSWIAFVAAILLSSVILAHHNIIFMVSPPRSASTGFLRMMEARGDFALFNEPSLMAFFSNNEIGGKYREHAGRSWQEVKKIIFEKAEHSPVFVKEMSFAVYDFIMHDEEFIKSEQVNFVFLLRNPHDALLSFYERTYQFFDRLVPGRFADLASYKNCLEMYIKIKESASNKPLIIKAEDLYHQPLKVVSAFCSAKKIPFKEEALSWQKLDKNFDGDLWHEIKYAPFTYHWHSDAMQSTQFDKLALYDKDESNNPTFKEISNAHHQELCKAIYLDNMQAYKELLHEHDAIIG
jgi:hypothetical protein